MDRKKFLQHFSRRLNQLMSNNGHESSRSNTGVDITKLAKICGCSYQMAKKYSLGLAQPDLHIVVKIAKWLDTSPSWLLFGENEAELSRHTSTALIEIEPELLKYILMKSCVLFRIGNNFEDIVNFIVDTIYDATHLNSDVKTIHKIIDMMIASATLLNNKEQPVNAYNAS